MPDTRLAIAIPHLNRTHFLKRLLPNLLPRAADAPPPSEEDPDPQTVPATIVVCDQGQTDETAELMAEYAGNPHIVHLKSPATCLWENWRYGADWAIDNRFEFVSWCQDDDVVHERYVERILASFDRFPNASAWTARLCCGENPTNAIWYSSNGPLVPMHQLKKRQRECMGELLAPVAYITSWALSPAVAFRTALGARETLAEQPENCDLFTERTVLASAGKRGYIICDPVEIGLWIHHGKNECYSQRKHQKEQRETFTNWMDDFMDGLSNWEGVFNAWCHHLPISFLSAFICTLDENSRYADAIGQIIQKNMGGVKPPMLSNQTIAGNAGQIGGEIRKVPALVI